MNFAADLSLLSFIIEENIQSKWDFILLPLSHIYTHTQTLTHTNITPIPISEVSAYLYNRQAAQPTDTTIVTWLPICPLFYRASNRNGCINHQMGEPWLIIEAVINCRWVLVRVSELNQPTISHMPACCSPASCYLLLLLLPSPYCQSHLLASAVSCMKMHQYISMG